MKKIYSIILTAAALLVLSPMAGAQNRETTYGEWSINGQIWDHNTNHYGQILGWPKDNGVHVDDGASFGYSKNISSPQSDGTYWIKLESFATGSATSIQTAVPTDFVIVIDNSGSMLEDCLYGKPRPQYVTAEQMADPTDTYYNFLRPAHTQENLFLGRKYYSYKAAYSQGTPGQRVTAGYDDNTYMVTGWSYFQPANVLASPSLYYYYETDETYYKIEREQASSHYYLYFTRTNGDKMYIHSTSATEIEVSTTPSNTPDNSYDNSILLCGYEGDNLYRPVNRVDELRIGFAAFMDSINDHNKNDQWADGVTKHQVAVVSFYEGLASGTVDNPSITPATGSLPYNQEKYTRVVKGFNEINDSNLASYKSVLDDYFNFRMGTATFLGLRLATSLLENLQTQEGMAPLKSSGQVNRNKVVVLFTDGEPKKIDQNGDTNSGTKFKNVQLSLSESEVIKAKRTEDGSQINGQLFSIDFAGSAGASRFLEYLSSNYTGTSVTTTDSNDMDKFTYSGTAITPAEDRIFYMDANNEGGLEEAFATIANAGTGSSTVLSASSANVDVVSNSFILPTIKNDESIEDYVQIYIAKLEKIEDGEYVFYEEFLKGHTPDSYTYRVPNNDGTLGDPIKADANIIVTLSGTREIKVKGFDYRNCFCGPVYKDNYDPSQHTAAENADPANIQGYQGYKLIIMIPIKMNPDAVGGPNVETNAPGSGIFITDGDASALVPYESPTVSLPVNIHISKKGLDAGESAKFKIERAVLPEGDVDVTTLTDWHYVSTVFVTKRKGTTGDPIVKVIGLPANVEVTEGEGDNATTSQKNVVYRITEETWSWSYEPQTEPQYTNTTSVTNPFIFDNKKKENIDVLIRHAESKATNIFKRGVATATGNARFDDSKDNGR